MMRPLSTTVLFSLLATGALPFSSLPLVQTVQAQSVDGNADGSKELARRRMAVRDAMLQVQEARNAYAAGRYTEAEEHYRNALAVLPKVPATARQQKFICQSLADALVARAIDYRKVGRSEEARTFLLEAIKLDPENSRAKRELVITDDPLRTNPALNPEHVGNVGEVQRLLELAYGQLDLANFDDACSTFQAVLRIDPYNTAARRGMESVQNRRQQYLGTARAAHRAKMLADVDAIYEESVPDTEALPDFGAVGSAEDTVGEDLKQSFSERLAAMEMPSIVFDGANIMEVIEALQNQIIRFEAAGGAAAGRHINLTANFGKPDTAAYKDLMAQEIRLNLSEVSVKDVLDLLVERLGIQYFYTDLGVQLCLGGRDSGPLMDRVFVVPPHFFDADKGDDEDDEDEDGGFSASASVKVGRISPKQALSQMGVTFPEGSSVSYSPSTRLLRVRNTMQNLETIEAAMDVPMNADVQIILSVIAIEVSENDLEQLGFDWLFNFSLGHGHTYASGGVQQAASATTGAPIISAELGRNASPAMTSGLRDAGALVTNNNIESLIERGSVYSYNQMGQAASPAIFGVRGVWNVADVTFVMRGLSQKKGVDVLQNPKIIFSPGNDEQIAFGSVQEMFFPETWEAGSVQAGRNNRNGNDEFSYSAIATGSHPTDFVRMGCMDDEVDGIGTTLVVHSAELEETEQGTFVNLALTTTVKEFEGFINWGSPINSAVVNQRGDFQFIELSPNYILQPMIKQRMENTQIRLAPGSVLVIGGVKEARSIQFEDKIPVLGDLPIVGRLFRSSGESNLRKALIFFVKVDCVDPTGRDIRTGERPSTEQ